MANKYRKKPVVISAVRVPNEKELHSDRYVIDFGYLAAFLGPGGPWFVDVDKNVVIKTLEGNMIANPGDWVIRGVKNELYPCKDDIFQASYERVE